MKYGILGLIALLGFPLVSFAAVSVTLEQDFEQTPLGVPFVLKWSSAFATTCHIRRITPTGVSMTYGPSDGITTSGTSTEKYSLPSEVGAHKITLICEGSGGSNEKTITHTVTGTASGACPTLAAYLQVGSLDSTTNGDVKKLQDWLFPYLYGSLPDGLPADRYFGQQTESAVRAFQSKFGIEQTGTVGPLTRKKIANACTDARAVSGGTDAYSVAASSVSHADASEKPDYRVVSAELSRVPPIARQAYTMRVTVANYGGDANNTSGFTILADGGDTAPDYRTTVSDPIKAGESFTYTLSNVELSKILSVGTVVKYTITADALNTVSESSETNNTLQIGPYTTASPNLSTSDETASSSMPRVERDAAARAIGYTGEFFNDFNYGPFGSWVNASGRSGIWSAIALKLIANPGETEAEIYSLFPALAPSYQTAAGVSKARRDDALHVLGYEGILVSKDASGNIVDGSQELETWLSAVAGRRDALAAGLAASSTAAVGNGPDYKIVSATPQPNPPKDNQPFALAVSITNAGNAAATATSTITAIAASTSAPRYRGTIAPLAAGQTLKTFVLTNLDPSLVLVASTTYGYIIRVDALNTIKESNEANNLYELSITPNNLTMSGLPPYERNALARAIGYLGEFGLTTGSVTAGVDPFGDWAATGDHASKWTTVWPSITKRLVDNTGESIAEIYTIFPNLDPSYKTSSGVTKRVRDQVLHALGYTGMLDVQTADGTVVYSDKDWNNWLDTNGKRAAFNTAMQWLAGQ